MKKISLAFVALSLSSIHALAAFPAANEPWLINIPQLSGGFFTGLSFNYLQPAATNGDLDYLSINTSITKPFHTQLKNVDPKYAWGWGINVGYIFPHTGNDVGFNYFHYEEDNGHFVTGTNLNVINPNIILNGTVSNYASARPEYDIDQVDVWAGQYINVGCRLILHPNVGMRWAQLERDINGTYIDNDLVNDGTLLIHTNVTTQEKSDFNGIGPLLGLDASYYLVYGFGFVGHFDSAVLAGNMKSRIDTTVLVSTPSIPPAVVVTNGFNVDDTMRIVPVLDAKLGMDYTYKFYNKADSDLTLEAGWQFAHYYRAVDRVYANGLGSSATFIQHKTSDVGFNGPYAYLVFHI